MAVARMPVPALSLELIRVRSLTRIVALLPLLAILILQGAVSLNLRNTAFQDEALYLYAGRQIFDHLLGGPAVLEPYATYFSGLPYAYPVLAGALDQLGGLELARLFSLVCMLWATTAVYLLARHFYDRDSAHLAAALFAVQGSVLFLGHLATFDALCLALLGLAAVLSRTAGAARLPFGALGIGAILFLAVVTKYAGLLFVPSVLALLFWRTKEAQGWGQAVLRVILAVAVLIAGTDALIHSNKDIATGLGFTTTNRHAIVQASRQYLFDRSMTLGGGLVALAAIGLLLTRGPRRLVAAILFGSALLAPAYHIYKGEAVSLPKHVAFGMLFAAPLAGHALARFTGYGRGEAVGRRWLAGLAICLLVFGQGINQARQLYNEWPTSNGLAQVLRTQVRPGSGHILAEEMEVPRYYLQDIVSFWQWSQLYWFDYTDRTGRHLSGTPAYRAAIRDGYFDLVVLRYGPNADTATAIDDGLRHGKGYDLIAKLPFSTGFGIGDYWVWRKRNGPAAH